MSTSSPACLRKAAIPSGRWKGPEKRRRTVLEAIAGLIESGTCVGSCVVLGVSLVLPGALGRPGGWSCPVSVTAVATVKLDEVGVCFQGNKFSSKRGEAAPEIYADPRSGLDARLRVGYARFYRESAAAEWQDGHVDSRLYAGQAFVRGHRAVRWSSCAVLYVNGMSHGVGPE
eukprot:3266934-Pleurochrysis_carterae.AAC.1